MSAIVAIVVLVAAAAAPADGPPILDDFDRPDETPLSQGGNWRTGFAVNPLGVTGGRVWSSRHNARAFRTSDYAGDVTAYVTIAVKSPGPSDWIELFVNLQQPDTTGWDGYMARVLHSSVELSKVTDGVGSALSSTPRALGSGQKVALRRSGALLQVWVSADGLNWEKILEHADTAYSGGKIGMGIASFHFADARLDDFGGGPESFPPPPPSPPAAADVLDTFDRAPENPVSQSERWAATGIDGGFPMQVLDGRLTTQLNDRSASAYRVAQQAGGGDMEAFLTIVSVPTSQNGLAVFVNLRDAGSAAFDGYALVLVRTNTRFVWQIFRFTDGAGAVIAENGAHGGPGSGDKMLLRRSGSTLEAWRYDAAGSRWILLTTARDTAHQAGTRIGVQSLHSGFGGAHPIDDFGGTEAGAPPPPPGGAPPASQTFGVGESGRGTHAWSGTGLFADPVNSRTGAFTTTVDDLDLPGTGVPFAWNRTYTSADATVGRLGAGWTDSYSASLAVEPSGDVRLHGEDGQQVLYARQADGSLVGAPGALSTLRSVEGGYELLRTDQVAYRFDATGRLLAVKDRNGQGVTLGYDAQGRLVSVTDAAGRRASVSYNAAGLVGRVETEDGRSIAYAYAGERLTSATDVLGKTYTYAYDADGRLERIVDPLGYAQVTNAYGPDGRVRSQTDSLGKVTTFAWNAGTETATATDANGNAWAHEYEDGVLLGEIDPLGNTIAFELDDDLNTSAVTSADGETTSMSYDDRGNLLSATAPESLGSARKTFVYNGSNDPVEVTDARGTVSSYAYDANGNPQRVVQDGTEVAAYGYDAAGRLVSSTDANGKTTTYAYDAVGNLVSETDALGSATTYTYDAAGRVLARVDPRGNAAGANAADFTWRWTYDAAGRVLTERDPLGGVTSHAYDDVGNEVSTTDANGRTTSLEYDDANRLVAVTQSDPDGPGPLPAPRTSYAYDDVGNKVRETDVLGRTTTFAYDAANRLAATTSPDPDGAGPLAPSVTRTTYDEHGDVANTVEPRGNVAGANPDDFRTRFAYDAAGRLLTTTDPLGHTTTNEYDAVGNLVSARDPRGNVTRFTYDAAGRLLTVTAPDGGVTAYTYDAAGNRLTRTDANGHVTSYTYDGAGRLLTETLPDPDGSGPLAPSVTSHGYDANGNVSATVDPNGNATPDPADGRTSFTYDAANRLIGIDYSDATPDVTYRYDAVGNRVSMTDGAGAQTRTYDPLNRLTAITRGADTFSYSYDAAGSIARRTYPGGTAIDYGYDTLGRLASVAAGGQTTSFAYDAASNLVQTTLPTANGHVESRAYDRAGRLIELTTRRGTTTLASFVATLDTAGNPTRIARTGALSQTQTFAYDPNDRLLSVCFRDACPGADDPFVRWTYDRVGNRLTEQRPSAAAATYTYDAADRLLQAGSTTYRYDANGNQLAAGSRTFTYDLANRLRTTRSGSSTTTTYSYDGEGVRLQASTGTSSSSRTNFVWDVSHALPQLALERNGSGSLLRRYTYGARLISMTAGSTTSYFHHDALGSVANVTASSGSRRWTYAYEPFGRIRTEQRSGDSAPTNFIKFAGEYLDPTGLYHLRARQYDPAAGRFLGHDPLEPATDKPLVSTYVYADGRPTVLTDPSGEGAVRANSSAQIWALRTSTWPHVMPPIPCATRSCAPPRAPIRPKRPALVHPIPLGFSASHGGVHPTGALPGYPALDFFPGAGAPVLAVQTGTIHRLSGNHPARGEVGLGIYGWSLYLRADSGSDYFYTHLGTRVGLGRVRAGQVIGTVGRWVRPSGENKSHLHLGVHSRTVTIDMIRRAPRVRA